MTEAVRPTTKAYGDSEIARPDNAAPDQAEVVEHG